MSSRSNANRPITPPKQEAFKVNDVVCFVNGGWVRNGDVWRKIAPRTPVRIYKIQDCRSTPSQGNVPSGEDVLYHFKVALQVTVEILGDRASEPVPSSMVSFTGADGRVNSAEKEAYGLRGTLLEATRLGKQVFSKGDRVHIDSTGVSRSGNTLNSGQSPWYYIRKLTKSVQTQEFNGVKGLGQGFFEAIMVGE